MNFRLNIFPFYQKKRNTHLIWKLVGGATLAAAGAGVVKMLPDIKRYVKINLM
ncbi:MAG TPA: hypothetical protein VJ302_13605 [Blastocatellia bacterium]|nr:hypothetical protein [Blastocatellia bacterium]